MAEPPSAELLLLQNLAWLKRPASRLANDRDDADDLVQDLGRAEDPGERSRRTERFFLRVFY